MQALFFMGATRLATPGQNKQMQRRSTVTTQALFTKKKPVVVEEEKPAPNKRSFFGGNKKTVAPAPVETTPGKTGFSLFGGSKKTAPATKTTTKTAKVDKAAVYKKEESFLSAFDFSTARSKSDAELLYDARYGKLENGKMSKEQYAALRRKVGGTSKDFFKGWVDVKGEYTDKGYVAKEETAAVPALPFLVGVVLALFGTLGYVVSQTSQ